MEGVNWGCDDTTPGRGLDSPITPALDTPFVRRAKSMTQTARYLLLRSLKATILAMGATQPRHIEMYVTPDDRVPFEVEWLLALRDSRAGPDSCAD